MAEELGGPEATLTRLATNATIMTPRQRETVERDIKVLEGALHGVPMPFYGTDDIAKLYQPEGNLHGAVPQGQVMFQRDMPIPDRGILEQDLAKCHETLRQNSVPELSGAAKNTLYAQYKAAWDAYQQGMPSHEQLWRPTAQNLHVYMRHQEANAKRGQFLQNVHRILDPHDDLFSLDMLRPEKSTPFNGVAYRAGYEQIQFQSEQELAMQMRELDDATYLSFLQYRAQGITSPKLYEEKLGIHRYQYEACVARLGNSASGMVTLSPEEEAAAVGRQPTPERAASAPPPPPSALSMVRLTAKAQEYVDTYGDVILTLEEEGALDENTATNFLHQVEPERFTSSMKARNVARVVLRSLERMGQLQRKGKRFVRPKPPGVSTEE